MHTPPRTSIIVTCKNRLHHLQQTMPTLVAQSDAEVIAVDYACAQGTRAWLGEHFPQVKVIAVDDDPVFHLARARNLGAVEARGQFLLFVDADVKIAVDLGVWLPRHAEENSYYQEPGSSTGSTCGSFACRRADFQRAEGYDEAFRGWGGEDRELYFRFSLAGIAYRDFVPGTLSAIPHGDAERQLAFAHGGMGSIGNGLIVNHLYMNIKYDLLRLKGKPLDLPERMEIMRIVKAALAEAINSPSAEKQRSFEINLANTIFSDLDFSQHFSKKLVYQVKPIPR